MPTEKFQLTLGAYTFDPARGISGLPRQLRAGKSSKPSAHYIVQFAKPLTKEERQAVQARYRLQLTDYLQQNAYLETLNPEQLTSLSSEPLVRATLPYHPGFKISPQIGKVPFRTPERQKVPGVWLRIILFPEADPDAVVRAVVRAGANEVRVLDDRKIGGQLRLQFVLPSVERLEEIARLEDVRWIEEVGEIIEDNGNTAGTIQSGTPGTVPIWDQGLHGEGQIIGIIDSPIDIGHCFFRDNVDNTIRPAHRKVVGFRNVAGATVGNHGTFVAGIAAGDDAGNPGGAANRGNAWAARLTFGSNADVPGTSSVLAYLNAAAADGAFVHTNSWHDDTAGAGNPAMYNQTAADVDTFTWNNEDHLVLGSAGNIGEEQGPPGTAKNAICMGASMADPNEMSFGDGNPGPTADGRRKPDMFAPGCSITSAQAGTTCTVTLDSNIFGFGPICATSWATPAAAAAAVLVRQYYTEGWYPSGIREPSRAFVPSGALLKATLLNSTLDMTNIAGYPGDQEGWGFVLLHNVLYFPGSALNTRVWDVHNVDGLFMGESRTHHVDVATNTQRLKVTLVWTEPPAAAGSANPVINNLDLVVTSPNGTQTFLGNNFAGGVSATGGVADTINNVEMALVNNPAPGDWTITVTATQVNVGNPGQGYALVVTADLSEPPTPLGNQDTLVVRVKFADVAFEPPLANLQNLMLDVADYFDEVSYGRTTVTPVFRGPINLDHPKDYYYHPERNLLIELTEEVIAKLVTAEATVFDRGTADPTDDIDRIIIVTNDVDFTGDWATTGPWPYSLPGGLSRPLSVSIQSYVNPAARFNHGLAHHFGLVDLYAHPGVVFPRQYVDEWDNMAGLYNNVHPLVWSKERAGWLSAHGDIIEYIPRPAAGGSYGGPNPIPIFFQESSSANRKAIAIGLSEGAATMALEDVFYFVEARSNTLGGYDDALPAGGVLIYYVNETIPQGQGPVILRDRSPATNTLADAVFHVGDSHNIPGTGITITVLAGTGGADFNIQVNYTPPVTDYNVFITRGDTIDGTFYTYYSPDIWVDSPRNGFNLGGGPPPHDQRENPVIGQVNRIYAKIHNAGPGIAFDFDVRFRISEPYHTVGGAADFDEFVGIKHIDSLGLGETIVFVEWTPANDGDPHSCVLVDLINLVGTDTNPNDNEAQENLQEVTSVTSSPFHPVVYNYDLTNPYEEAALFYFRSEGAPPDWKVTLNPRKIRLNPGEHMLGSATIEPPEKAEVCTAERIVITSWTPRGDTLIEVGGGIVQVNLRKPTLLTLDVSTSRCDGKDLEELLGELKKEQKPVDPVRVRKRCGHITVQGCTIPSIANQEIIVKFVDPYGNPVYHTVKTDENGCFEDFLVTAEPGVWQVTAEYLGDKCQGPAVGGPQSVCWCQ
ncbi:MAG: S8 family serine peptidase [Caldilineaceae bacterium]